jgi:hypothetical protein
VRLDNWRARLALRWERYLRDRLFRYQRGQAVRWGDSVLRWRIVQRRWTERESMAPLVEYGLVPQWSDMVTIHWAYEADVVPIEK